jgi:soluble lytic murein transglycosylase-like protein
MKYDAEVSAAIARWAPVYGVTVEPALVHAIIQRESSHGAQLETAESKGRKSYGPMMVLDDTARALGVSNPANLRDPAQGISVGVRYFASLLKKFPGDTARAISAYNTGPGNAVRNQAGRFPNQSYVDAVTAWWKTYKYAVATATSSGLVLVAIMLFFWFQLRRRRG